MFILNFYTLIHAEYVIVKAVKWGFLLFSCSSMDLAKHYFSSVFFQWTLIIWTYSTLFQLL